MKPKLSSSALAEAGGLEPPSNRLSTAFSPQNLTRQAGPMPVSGAALRVPVLPQNRAYLKALRQAELAAWEVASSRSAVPARKPASVRLPAPSRDARESWLYALLTAQCLLLFCYELWSMAGSAGNWRYFVQFVRQLLG